MNSYSIIITLGLFISLVKGQRVAPGVPPQHYQQQQYQQYGQPQQYQQIPVQQQVPIQQQQQQMHGQHQQPMQQQQQQHMQQQQQPMQQQQQMPIQQQVPMQQQIPVQHQVPVQGGHQQGHHHEHTRGQILNAANVAQEAQHIAEHMEVPIDTSKMTEQELQFHYFKMHDADNNNKLDGCELIKSLIHWHEQGSKEKPNTEDKVFKDEELINLIDPILSIDDSNKDGYIDYPEFIRAQQKAAGQTKSQA